jgi:nucleotide-binding universal stress UspA family protein
MNPIKMILHPTDFSKHSQYALGVVCALARDQDARLLILHVVPSAAPVTGGGDVAALRRAECGQQDLKSYREEMLNKLQHLPLPGLKARVERLLKEGDAAKVILSTAQDSSCDLIVMGTYGKTGQARQLMGSVAEEVMQKASCPVLTVKVPLIEPRPTEQLAPEEAGVIL